MFFFPGLIDHHVHLGLIDRGQLGVSLLGRIHDLGWDPAAINGLAGELPADLEVRFVGPFHTAPGGYPSGRGWAPPASVRGVDSVRDAHRAVDRAVELGADAIKITLHAQFPLLDDATLAALVHAAHEHGIPAVVHAEGAGLAERAIAAGADQLAHTPWTTPLSASWIRRAAEHTRWCSTLHIHSGAALDIALRNARAFVDAGGRLLYGTDLGNGPTPPGALALREIELLGAAGLSGAALLHAFEPVSSDEPPVRARIASPDPMPERATLTASELIAWLAGAKRVASDDAAAGSDEIA